MIHSFCNYRVAQAGIELISSSASATPLMYSLFDAAPSQFRSSWLWALFALISFPMIALQITSQTSIISRVLYQTDLQDGWMNG